MQGANAPESLCKAIEKADASELDLLICGRGGGSFEDLMAFNNEQLARTIYNCNTPIISAVGHETDFTICDFVSDLRAPTPSAAAELAVPDMTVIYNKLNVLTQMLAQTFIMQLDTKYRRLEILEKRIEDAVPFARINLYKEKLSNIEKSLDSAYKNKLLNCSKILAEKSVQLDALSPLKTLARGYSLVYKEEQLVKSTEAVSTGDKVDIHLSNGTVSATIN